MKNYTFTYPLPEIPPLSDILYPTILNADYIVHGAAYLIACFSITCLLILCIAMILFLVTFILDLLSIIDFYAFWRELRDTFDFFLSIMATPIRLY